MYESDLAMGSSGSVEMDTACQELVNGLLGKHDGNLNETIEQGGAEIPAAGSREETTDLEEQSTYSPGPA